MTMVHVDIFRTVTVTHQVGVKLAAKNKSSTPQTSYLRFPNQQISLNLQVSSGKSLKSIGFIESTWLTLLHGRLSSYQEFLLIFNTYFR